MPKLNTRLTSSWKNIFVAVSLFCFATGNGFGQANAISLLSRLLLPPTAVNKEPDSV